jgi:putative GTP pyrophosphokinase
MAVEDYRKIRPLYKEYAMVIRKILMEAFSSMAIKIHSTEARAKDMHSFGEKAVTPAPDDPNRPYYPNPLSDITDLSGVRVIVFFPRTLDLVDGIINTEFDVLERSDKKQSLIKEDKFGYGSIHYLVRLKDNRTHLLEYARFNNLVAEIQLRTILQHGWAEIEHDIQYKAIATIPTTIRRRFMALAGLLEIADREFQAIQDEDERLTLQARKSVQEGKLEQVEITPDALKAYLDKRLGPDGRMRDYSYQWTAKMLRDLGFSDFRQIEECISGYDDDQLSRICWGSRQGQLSRLECMLLAGMGENFIKCHIWKDEDWFVNSRRKQLDELGEAGVATGAYVPTKQRLAEPVISLDPGSR